MKTSNNTPTKYIDVLKQHQELYNNEKGNGANRQQQESAVKKEIIDMLLAKNS